MLFNDEFIASLQDDPINGALTICKTAISKIQSSDSLPRRTQASLESKIWSDLDFDILAEAYALLTEVIDSKLLSIDINYPNLDTDLSLSNACPRLHNFLTTIQVSLTTEALRYKVQIYRSKSRRSLGTEFSYEFSQGDLERIQILLNELRDLIANANQLDKEHKQRLISRLEKMQSEIHKKASDLDRFWGLVGESGVVLGKLAEDSKPIVDRIRELANIVWRTQARAEELPSGTGFPLLGQKSFNSEDT